MVGQIDIHSYGQFLRLPRQCQLPQGSYLPTHHLQVFGTSSEEHMEAIARVKKAKVSLCTPRQVLAGQRQYLGGRKGCQGAA